MSCSDGLFVEATRSVLKSTVIGQLENPLLVVFQVVRQSHDGPARQRWDVFKLRNDFLLQARQHVLQPVKIALGQQGVGNRQEGFHHPRELQERFVQIQRDEGVKPLPYQRDVEGIHILQWRVDEQSSKHANQHRVASHVLLEENGREIGFLVQTRDEKGAF